jgi:hypothetical protein
MANIVYNKGKAGILDGSIDWLNDTIKLMAVTSTYTPNADHSFIDEGGASDPVDARASGTTDQAIGTKSVVKDNTNDFGFLKGASVTYAAVAAGSAIVGFVAYKDTGTPTTSPLLAYYDTADITPNGGDITFNPASDANGGYLKAA